MEKYTNVIPLLIGFFLDSILGDPRWLPHPIRWFGKIIALLDKQLNCGNNKRLKGIFTVAFLVSATWLFVYGAQRFLNPFPLANIAFNSILVFYGIANRGLITEALKVENRLEKEGLEAARKQLGNIVGRDTAQLSPNQVRTAVLETLAENLSDGVVAPLFFYAIGGVPLMFAYKMINTLDSMLAYKNEKYKYFGWCAARVDDIANYIPARLTAILMVALTLSRRGVVFIFKYGHQHASPNSGYPEAALAGILNCRFGGPNFYHGKLVDKPFIGHIARDVHKKDIYRSALLNFLVCLLTIALAMAQVYVL